MTNWNNDFFEWRSHRSKIRVPAFGLMTMVQLADTEITILTSKPVTARVPMQDIAAI